MAEKPHSIKPVNRTPPTQIVLDEDFRARMLAVGEQLGKRKNFSELARHLIEVGLKAEEQHFTQLHLARNLPELIREQLIAIQNEDSSQCAGSPLPRLKKSG